MGKTIQRLIAVASGALIVLGLTFAAGVVPVQAADTIELTYGGTWPPTHPMSVATQDWINKIEKDSNGRSKSNHSGPAPCIPPKTPLWSWPRAWPISAICPVPMPPKGMTLKKPCAWLSGGSATGNWPAKCIMKLLVKFPQLTREFTDNGIKVMAYAGIPPYQLLLAKKTGPKNRRFQGLDHQVHRRYVQGGFGPWRTGIVMPMGEAYTALQKTTIDGVFAPYETMKTFRFAEVVDYALQLDIGSAPAGHWGFCLKSWEKLPTGYPVGV